MRHDERDREEIESALTQPRGQQAAGRDDVTIPRRILRDLRDERAAHAETKRRQAAALLLVESFKESWAASQRELDEAVALLRKVNTEAGCEGRLIRAFLAKQGKP